MRRSRALRFACVFLLVSLLAVTPAIAAEEAGTRIPFGKYTGTAVGEGGKAKAFPVTLYISEGKSGAVEITAVTPKLPIPVSVESPEAQIVPGGFDVPVSASITAVALNGDGVLRLRKRESGWVVFASGSGSWREKPGSGRGFGTRVSESSTAGEQVLDAAQGFFSFGPAKTTSGQTVMPEQYSESEWVKAPQQAADAGSAAQEEAAPPPGILTELWVLLLLIILLFVFVFLA